MYDVMRVACSVRCIHRAVKTATGKRMWLVLSAYPLLIRCGFFALLQQRQCLRIALPLPYRDSDAIISLYT